MGSPPAAAASSEPPRVGAGLQNLGNTCFLNSILQCLMYTGPLVEKILRIEHTHSHNGDKEEFCSICCLKELINNCLFSRNLVIVPNKFAENLSKISPSFCLGQEEDAHEFLGSMLNSLDDCYRGGGTEEKKPSNDDNIVNKVFGGSVSSQLRCCDCGYCSKTLEPLLDLSLEIDEVDTIEGALASYTKVEAIEGRLTCEGCKAQVSMEKQLKLDRVPEVVTLHLKRFKFSGFRFDKIYKHVAYPLELDFRPFLRCPDDNVDMKYDLYAVVVHHGSIASGHYFCFVHSSPTTWHRMNDSMVTKVCETNVLCQDAYLLFYTKRNSSCWLSNLMETRMCLAIHNSPIFVMDTEQANRTSPASEGSCNVRSLAIHSPVSEPIMDMFADESEQTSPVGKISYNIATVHPFTSESVMDIFVDESSETESEEESGSPQCPMKHRSTRTLKFLKDQREQGQALKLLRTMPGLRRQGLMACMLTMQAKYKHGRRMLQKSHKKHNT